MPGSDRRSLRSGSDRRSLRSLEAVVVGSVDFGEADRVVRLLSGEEGRGAVLARGARASKRRWAGVLEPGTRVRVERRGRGDLPLVVQAEAVQAPRRAREDLERIALLAYGCELCASLAPEGHPADKLHRLLCAWLDLLEGDASPGVASRVALEGKALAFAGLRPALVSCARCGRPLQDDAVFDAEAGGALHPGCGAGARVPMPELARIDAWMRTPLAETAGRVSGLPGTSWLLSDFARHQLGRELRSRGLLEHLDPKGP